MHGPRHFKNNGEVEIQQSDADKFKWALHDTNSPHADIEFYENAAMKTILTTEGDAESVFFVEFEIEFPD